MAQCASSNPLEQFSVATRVVAYSSRNDLARLCQVSQLWQRVAQRELERRRCCPIAKHGLLAYEWPSGAPANGIHCRLSYAELAKRFGLLLTELRADWHLPYRLLVFCDVEFLRAKLAATAGGMAEAELGSPPAKRSRRRQQTAASASSSASSSSSTASAGRGSSHLQALKAFAAAELPPGARLHLAGSFAGAIGTPEGTAGVPVEMETGKSSDGRQMHGLAHVRLYTCPGDDPRRFGVASAGEPLPPGASPKLLLALPNRNGNRRFGAGQPERRLLAEHPDMIVCGGLCSYFHTEAAGATDEAGSDAGIDHSRLVFYGDRLRVLSAMVTDAEDLERTLRSLKLSSLQPLLPGQCLAFMFICCAKGSKHYLDQPDIETGVFSRLLPGVPVLGLFSEGEFSRNCSPGERFADVPSPPLGLRAYRTSLCVLSWSKGPPDPKCHSPV
ncbi:hypothetical protein BOX15_Mlig006101g2 [Macrostomum lignano]|uniref:FIST_C domain-containing protein n=1 Tax=Macrostomum lignano TaxID=282301 RepID=A0A267H2E5_9PLAT|nr:hypothetical protein BOX15_Mlig006101g2 [Macrostomum lignano]